MHYECAHPAQLGPHELRLTERNNMENLGQKIRQIIAFVVSVFTKSKSRNLIDEKEDTKRENLEKLRDFIRGRERITNDETENLLGVSNATAERYLDELEKEGPLEQMGKTGKYTYYKVK